MIEAIGSATIKATSQDILEFVTDLNRYRFADTKISTVLKFGDLQTSDRTAVRYRGRLRGLPTPADTNEVHLTRWTRVDFIGSSTSWVRRFVDFQGWFTCLPTDDGTVVTHGERFAFRAPGRWVIEPYLRSWLEIEMIGEMQRMKECLEAGPSDGR